MRRRLALTLLPAAALVAGCGPFGEVDTDGIENDVRVRLTAAASTSSPIGGGQSSPPAVSVSCPNEVKSEKDTRFRCSASVTQFRSKTTDPIPGGAPGITAPSADTQEYVVEGTVTSDSGDARWTLRPRSASGP